MNKNPTFENKVSEEKQKRKNIVNTANGMIHAIEQHCEECKKESESVDLEKIELFNQIHEAADQKDFSKLSDLLERIR
jgi:hypothetical protein